MSAGASAAADSGLSFLDILGYIGAPATIVGVAVTIALGIAWLVQGTKGARLWRRMNAGKKRGAFFTSAGIVLSIAWKHRGERKLSDDWLLRAVRRRVEHEIFQPRPEFVWPLRDDHEWYRHDKLSLNVRGRSEADAADRKAAAKAAYLALHDKALAEWKPAPTPKGDLTITLDLAADLNDALSDIKLYFDMLKVLDVDRTPDDLEFLCPISIKTGFIASQHLLAGLLVRYNQKWGDIINGFENDTSGPAGLDFPAGRDFRQIQSFIYHCWLLWGPSVPICKSKCDGWRADYTTLQYGYGDENNSIEIVGRPDLLHKQLGELLEFDEISSGVMAVAAAVTGYLRYSSVADLTERKVPKVLRASWDATHDDRPILYLSRERGVDVENSAGIRQDREAGTIEYERIGGDPTRSRYFSAYFWVMFVLMKEVTPGVWQPIDVQSDAKHPAAAQEVWKASIPFFEHGNMADRESCAFAKRQLSDKALSGLAHLVALAKKGQDGFNYRFAYACAIDDANCSKTLAVEALQGGRLVRDLMKARLEKERLDLSSDVGALAREGIIDFLLYDPKPDQGKLNPHASCCLSADVARHYDMMRPAVSAAAIGTA